jgi:hypothetical protein
MRRIFYVTDKEPIYLFTQGATEKDFPLLSQIVDHFVEKFPSFILTLVLGKEGDFLLKNLQEKEKFHILYAKDTTFLGAMKELHWEFPDQSFHAHWNANLLSLVERDFRHMAWDAENGGQPSHFYRLQEDDKLFSAYYLTTSGYCHLFSLPDDRKVEAHHFSWTSVIRKALDKTLVALHK